MNNKLTIPENINYSYDLLDKASVSIGEYNNAIMSNSIMSPESLVYLMTLKESETTSRIEGTKITFQDLVLDKDDIVKNNKRSPVMEALGVRFAIDEGNKMLKDGLPISNRFIKSMHKSLMQHAQYENKNIVPGEFRGVDVRVGNYRPPQYQMVLELMGDLEKYIHNMEINISPIVKVGIIHAQFERIHPFADGNGRIGRLLISFLLKEYGLTSRVSYFMSPYIENDKDPYYDGLEFIESENGWEKWIEAFLGLVINSSNYNNQKIEQLNSLYKSGDFLNFYNKNSQHIKNFIFINPVFRLSKLVSFLEDSNVDFSVSGIRNQLNNSQDINLLSSGKGRSSSVYECKDLMNIFVD